MIEAINTDHEQFTLLWWCIGVSVLAVLSFVIVALSFQYDKGILFGVSLSVGMLSVAASIFMWGLGYLPNTSDGSYNKSTVTGEITALANDIAVIDGVPLPVDLGDSADLAEVGDVISAECREAFEEFNCYEVGLVK